ncbi:MAG: hypothetical protein QXD27_09280 [Metallosphaera sp.]
MTGLIINFVDIVFNLFYDLARYSFKVFKFIGSKVLAGIFYDIMASFRYVNDITRRVRTYVR